MEFTEKALIDKLSLTSEEIKEIADGLEKQLDFEATTNLIGKITQVTQIDEKVKAELTMFDRIALLVKTAYKFGYLGALVTHSNASRESIHDLFNPNNENKLDS